jgi:hypothetical protein
VGRVRSAADIDSLRGDFGRPWDAPALSPSTAWLGDAAAVGQHLTWRGQRTNILFSMGSKPQVHRAKSTDNQQRRIANCQGANQ